MSNTFNPKSMEVVSALTAISITNSPAAVKTVARAHTYCRGVSRDVEGPYLMTWALRCITSNICLGGGWMVIFESNTSTDTTLLLRRELLVIFPSRQDPFSN